jgi:hypothetical protein
MTVHIMPPIYPDETLGEKLGAEKMKEEAYALCKAKYEEVYGIPLSYGEEISGTESAESCVQSTDSQMQTGVIHILQQEMLETRLLRASTIPAQVAQAIHGNARGADVLTVVVQADA